MPKIPLDFSYGAYSDDSPRAGDRVVLNCYPETTQGDVDKTIVRGVEGYEKLYNGPDFNLNNGIIVGTAIYYVAGRNLYRTYIYTGATTLLAVMSTAYNSSPAIMESNGKTIVILCPGHSSTADHYWDIVGNTGGTMASKSGIWTGFGEAIDVCVKDGYYFFITYTTTFHGSNSNTTDGLTFNALSFQPLPTVGELGVGVAVSNSQIYVMTQTKTYVYQTASTTPYSFARSVGFDIDIGLTSAFGKVAFDDQLFMIGTRLGSAQKAYMISGTSYNAVSNSSVETNFPYKGIILVSAFEVRGHRMVQVTNNPVQTLGTGQPQGLTQVYDLTESMIKGVNVWHERKLDQGSNTKYPIKKYLDNQKYEYINDKIYALGLRDGVYLPAIYQIDTTQSIGAAQYFGDGDADTDIEYSFNFLRNQGDSVTIKKLRIRFTDGIKTAELFVTQGSNVFTSLGEIDLTTVDSKTAEWRRLGRFNSDASFKIKLIATSIGGIEEDGNDPVSILEGFIEV